MRSSFAAAVALDPSHPTRALEGQGTLATVAAGAGRAVSGAIPGVAGHALSDLINLPAQIPPSLYLLGASGLEAAQGRPQRWEQLKKSYLETDFLPALLSGHLGEAAKRVGEHPLYSALEASGIRAALGRGAGAAIRAGRGPEYATRERPPLQVSGRVAERRGPYSRDAFTRAVQEARDVRAMRERHTTTAEGEQAIRATPKQATRYLRQARNYMMAANRGAQLTNLQNVLHKLHEAEPSNKSQADVASLMAQAIVRSPETMVEDLTAYRESLVKQQKDLPAAKLAANRQMVNYIDAALKHPDPEAVAHLAQEFAKQQAPIVDELVDRGLLNRDQAEKAVVIPFARTRMGATHGLSKADRELEQTILGEMKGGNAQQLIGRLSRVRARTQLLKPNGEPLSTEEVVAEMARQGVTGERGFLSHRPGGVTGARSFYRNFAERQRLSTKRRTGAAAAEGTFDPGFESLRGQIAHDRTVLDATKAFDRMTNRFVVAPRVAGKLIDEKGKVTGGFKDAAEAALAAEHPEYFGLKLEDVPGGYVPIRLAPFLSMKTEIEAALGHGDPAAIEKLAATDPHFAARVSAEDHGVATDALMERAIATAAAPGPGPYGLIPQTIWKGIAEEFASRTSGEKAFQAMTGAFKGAVLPTSPGWMAGNVADNWLVRSGLSGVSPREMLSGKKFVDGTLKAMTDDEAMMLVEHTVPGGLMGTVRRMQPYRSLEQFTGSWVEPIWKAFRALKETPGPKQLHHAFTTYRDAVFEWNSRYVERFPQYGALSKVARRDVDMTRRQFVKAVKTQDPAIQSLMERYRNTDEQIRLGREVKKIYGNWNVMSPGSRRFLSQLAPFWTWMRAATSFVLVTLPRDHPIVTGMLAAAGQMTREERQKLGLDFQAESPMPPFLQGSIPGPGGSALKTSNLTSFGFVGNFPQSYGSIFAPQVMGPVLSALGLDWKGDKLVTSEGKPASQWDAVKVGLMTFGDQFVPFLNVANQIKKHGAGGVSPVRSYPRSLTDYLRNLQNQQTIRVPIKGAPQIGAEGGGASSANPWSGGSSTQSNPWAPSGSSASSSNPWAP